MKNETPQEPSGQMNRRTMLGTATALIGGAMAGVGGNVFAQEKPKAASAAASAGSPNLSPPVVQIKAGKIPGLPGGKTSSFLGIPDAEADRVEPPQTGACWTGDKNAQVPGPGCPGARP